MRLNKIAILLYITLISCMGSCQKKDNKDVKTELLTSEIVNFFDKEYNSKYSLKVDASTPADYPLRTFLDCNKAYFTIHYIPKRKSLRHFWKEEFPQEVGIYEMDADEEHEEIEKIMKNSVSDYEIFCYYVPAKYLKTNGLCSPESVYLDDHAIVSVFHYSTPNKKWSQVKKEKSSIIPTVVDTGYFIKEFPQYFTRENLAKSLSEIREDFKKQGYRIFDEKDGKINEDGAKDKVIVLAKDSDNLPTSFKVKLVFLNER